VLEGGGCLEHASIKPKALTDGEGFEGLSAVWEPPSGGSFVLWCGFALIEAGNLLCGALPLYGLQYEGKMCPMSDTGHNRSLALSLI
jgi:hypothetical protein